MSAMPAHTVAQQMFCEIGIELCERKEISELSLSKLGAFPKWMLMAKLVV